MGRVPTQYQNKLKTNTKTDTSKTNTQDKSLLQKVNDWVGMKVDQITGGTSLDYSGTTVTGNNALNQAQNSKQVKQQALEKNASANDKIAMQNIDKKEETDPSYKYNFYSFSDNSGNKIRGVDYYNEINDASSKLESSVKAIEDLNTSVENGAFKGTRDDYYNQFNALSNQYQESYNSLDSLSKYKASDYDSTTKDEYENNNKRVKEINDYINSLSDEELTSKGLEISNLEKEKQELIKRNNSIEGIVKDFDNLQTHDYYEYAKEVGGKDLEKVQKYLASYDDAYIQRLGNLYAASVADVVNTPIQALEILNAVGTRNTDNPYDFTKEDSPSSILSNYSQEMRSYAMANTSGFETWSLDTVSSLMPMVNFLLVGKGLGLQGEALNTFTNVSLGVQTAGQTTRQRVEEGNSLTTSAINGAVHGVITSLIEGFSDKAYGLVLGDTAKDLLSDGLLNSISWVDFVKQVNQSGLEEGGEEVAEALADWVADNGQNLIAKYFFNQEDQVRVEEVSVESLSNAFIMAYAGSYVMAIPSGRVVIDSKQKYNAVMESRKYFESKLNSELSTKEQKDMASACINAIDIDTQNYREKSVLADAVDMAKDRVPQLLSFDEAMNNLTNAVQPDVKDVVSDAQQTLEEAQNLKGMFEESIQQRGWSKNLNVDDYLKMDEEQKHGAKVAVKFGKDAGIDVTVGYNNLPKEVNGKIASGNKIVVDAKNKPVLKTLTHELTHGTEMSSVYETLDKLVSDRFIQENGDLEAITKAEDNILDKYNRVGNEQKALGNPDFADFRELTRDEAHREFVAKQVENLLGNEQFVKDLVKNNNSLASKIYDYFKKADSDELLEIKDTFKKAFEEFEANKQSAQYSIDDSKITDNRDILNTNYSEKEIDITHNNGDYIEGLDYSIEDFFNNFKNSPEQKILLLGKVNNDFTNKVLKDTGIDLNGKSLALASDNHLDNNMGALHNLANILNDYDSVEYYIENGEQRLRFKTDTNNDYSVIELVPKRNISSLLVNNYTNENKNVKYSIDTDYEQAVNNGDMETAQKLVDEKANEWANSEDNKQVIVNGKKVLFRSADGGKTVFDRSANGHTNNVLFMTTDENVARGFDSSRTGEKSNITKFFVRGNNVLEIEANGDIYAGITVDENNVPEWYPTTYNVDWNNEANDYVQTVSVDLDNLVEKAFDNGYDVVVAKNVKEGTGDITNDVIVKDSRTQIKSAEPVTYDNNGNVIPLSERFNSNNKDIRWSIDTEETSASKQSDDALKFAEQIIDNNGKVVEEAKENTEDIAKVLSEVPEKENKKEQLKYWLDKFKYYITNSGVYVDNIAKETGNKKISEKYDYMLMSDTMANSALADGHYDIYGNKIDNGIVGVFEGLTDEKRSDFDNYIYHLRNINDMSITDRFKPQAVVDLAEELMKNDKNLTYTDAIKKASEELVSKKTKEIAKGSKISKEDAKEQAYNSIFSEYQNKPVFGESVTAEKSKEFTKEMEEKHPDFKERSKRLFEYENNELQLLYQYGIINEEQMNRMTAMHYNFAPIMRDVDVQKGAGTTNANKALKAQKGSNLDILPLDYAIINRTNSIYRSITSNNLYKEIYGSMKMEGTKGKSVSLLDEFSTNLLDIDKNTRSKYITLYENGQPIQLEIGDGLYDSLKPNRVVKLPVLSSLADFRRNMITGWNPIFWITNGMKDIQDVPYNTKFNAVEYTKGYAEAWKQITNHGKLYDLYLANGGAQNSRIKQFTGEVKSTSDVKQLFNFGEVIETVPRLAEFIATLNNGGSIEEAMFNASEVTVNFKRGGVWSKNLNANGFTFLNASILGTVKQMNNIKQAYTKKGAIGVASYMAKMSLMYNVPLMLLNYLLWRDDDDYEQLSEYVKNNYYCIGKVGHTFIRLPKGRLNAFYQTCISNGVKTAQGKQDLWEALLSDAESFATNIAPNKLSESSLIAPIEQAIKGKNWYGGDIVPSRLQDVPEENQFDESIDEISKWIGKKTHTSPYKINYILDQYTGLAGDFVLPMFTLQATNGIDNKIVSGLASPILDKFTSNSIFKNQYVSDFYEMKNELNTQSKYDDASDEVKLSNKYMATMMYELNQLYKKKREIQNKTDLSNGDKYDQVEEIQMQIDALAKVALETYDQIDKVDNYAIVGDLEYHKTEDGWEKLTSKQLEKVKGLNLTTGEKSEFFDTYSEINDAREELKENTPEGEQADYSELTMSEIFNSGLDDSAKNRLYDTYYGSTFTSNVNKMSYDDATKLKIKSIVATTESDKDKDGNTISNSKAQKVKEQYIALGVYDDIVKYIQDNDLKYTVFGLSKTVVEGSTKSSGKSSKSKSTLATTYAKTFKSSDVGSTNTSTKQTSLSGFKKAYSNTLKTSGKTSNGYAYVTCPNCHSRVIPSNNTCPVCGNKL